MKYLVGVQLVGYETVEVEANSEAEAKEKALTSGSYGREFERTVSVVELINP